MDSGKRLVDESGGGRRETSNWRKAVSLARRLLRVSQVLTVSFMPQHKTWALWVYSAISGHSAHALMNIWQRPKSPVDNLKWMSRGNTMRTKALNRHDTRAMRQS
ncbi:hypothetical protein HO173_005553 [Letharia columbiana]|uniref:Uncharacterized protein n=1 Tax=Letharia columbiana TaxID=112416 RepID=A0A8H6L5I9_9LECA|nr:uncharacterized protein HO173_005553 [Letharia columbiana]KAF6236300.1 hypothetical protein HO173_005553 [Letharia columbiana]